MPLETPFGGREVPLVSGFLRGYRAWIPWKGKLRSTSYMTHWEVGRNTASCRNLEEAAEQMLVPTDHELPICTCGDCGGMTARDRYRELQTHPVPSLDSPVCQTCGFYAAHTAGMYRAAADTYISHDAGTELVLGSIKATGRVIVGKCGFRAEHVEVEALAGQDAGGYPEIYGVPWINGKLEDLAEQFPPTKVDGVDYDWRPGTHPQPHWMVIPAASVAVSGFPGNTYYSGKTYSGNIYARPNGAWGGASLGAQWTMPDDGSATEDEE